MVDRGTTPRAGELINLSVIRADPASVGEQLPDDAARSYARSQLDHLEGHVQAIIVRLLVFMPELRYVADDLRAEMVNGLRRLAGAVMQVLADGSDFDELAPMLEGVARRRKSLGIDQAQTMRSSRHGQQALHEHAREFFRGHPQEAEMMAQLVPRLLEFQHVMTLSVARGYATGEPMGDSPDRQARLQSLLEVMLGRHPSADGADTTALANALADDLGIALPLTMVTVSATIGPDAAERARSVARMNHWAVVGVIGERVVALTVRRPNAFGAPSGRAELPSDLTPEQVAATVSAAGNAADVADRLNLSEMTTVDAAPFAAVLALPQAEQEAFVRSCFGSLPGTPRGQSLLTAVSASLTHGRMADAAGVLHVHRHTLDYRLRRFSEQTGLDLGDPVVRFRCTLGLFLIGLLPAPE